MNVCVFGLWHLGTVTAACLAEAGHDVIGLDSAAEVIENLQRGQPPIFEPGLSELVQKGSAAGKLRFTTDPALALRDAAVVWVAFDTPVDDEDRADVGFVVDRVQSLFPHLAAGRIVLVSSQVPVGTTATLEKAYRAAYSGHDVVFGYSPENLRLGKAIQVFLKPDRVVIGTTGEAGHAQLAALLQPITENIVWMSVESAEMTKHALNAFLATSVAFMNELATLCEQAGADASEVERGLKTETRIGPYAYLRPGAAFAGGTLARDLQFLTQLGSRHRLEVPLFNGVIASNKTHRNWAYRRLHELLGDLHGKVIAILGLTYKPGTSTLRRSEAVDLCRKLIAEGANVRAYDPQAEPLPPDLAPILTRSASTEEAMNGAKAMIICTEWPDFKNLTADSVLANMADPLILDANRFLGAQLMGDPRIRYYTVGKSG